MNLVSWLKGLAAAIAGGAVTSAAAVAQNRLVGTPDSAPLTGKNIGIAAGIGALLTTIPYLMKSPIAPAPEAPPEQK